MEMILKEIKKGIVSITLNNTYYLKHNYANKLII